MATYTTVSPKVIGTKKDGVSYVERQVIRVVTFNAAGKIPIIHAKRDNYYKLPGGGIEPGEEHGSAAQREMQEETGGLVKVRAGSCVAATEEFRNDLHQISFCYCADLVDDTGAPSLTDEEIQD